jgi:uncharacterized protein involved in outer membrane biogenesis
MTAASLFAHVVRRLRILRPYLIALAAVFGAYLLFGWLVLPGILQSQAEKYILERSGHQLTMDRPSFNPLLLDLHIKNLRLAKPDGQPLLSFNDLLIDFSPVSAFRRAYVFNEIRFGGLTASVEVLPEDRLNWSDLLESLQTKEETTSEEQKPAQLPRLIIRKFALSGGRLDLADRRTSLDRSASIVPIDVELTDLSTLPNEEGKYELTAKTNFGAGIDWDGQVALNPLSVAGKIHIDDLPLSKLATFAPVPETLEAPEGTATVSVQYQAGMIAQAFDVRLDDLAIGIDGFRIQGKADSSASLALDHVDLKGGQFDLLEHRIAIDTIAASGGGINTERTPEGRINLLDLIPTEKKEVVAPADAPSAVTARDWHYSVAHMTLDGFSAGFRDRTIDPAADFALQDIAADVSGLSEDMAKPLPVHLGFHSRDGGTFSADGTVVPDAASAELQIKLDGLAIKPAQPYLGHLTTLNLIDGTLSSEGHATYDAKGGQYTGSLALQNLRIVEADGSRPFLAWKSLATKTLSVSPQRIAIRELLLNGLDTRLIIAKDKSVSLTKILKPQPDAPPSAPPAPTAPSPFQVGVERLQIQNSQLEFADQSLALPFGTHIHALAGTVVNLSSKEGGAPARLNLGGQIEDYGQAKAEGRIDLFKPTNLLDIKVAFTNVEMTKLTPYAATFAGRRIDSGKLSLNLQYGINNRQLTGNNQVIMDQLTLGDRVESPEAHDLPLDLAIALLEDSNGRIDLGLPVSGSLDDPQFSYGRILWEAFENVLTKIVTSPFRALGALFGSDDKPDGVVFEPGQSALSPPELENLGRFATALNERPNLTVTVHGTWSDADRVALQDLALRKALAGKLGLSSDGDPGPITPDQPEVKPALEDLYADQFGKGALAGLKEGYRKANPGQLPETTGGQVMSVLTGLIGTKPSLSDQDIDAMKGADFHAMLYQKLRDAEEMPDVRLQALAQARGEGIMKELSDANAPLDRVTLQSAEKVDATDNGIPLKMDMASAARP